jgi:hypothetical protein
MPSPNKGKFEIRADTFDRFPIRINDPFVGVGRISLLQENNPPPKKGLHHMSHGKPGYPELLNTCNMFLHPCVDERDQPRHFIGHGH